ncbi:hypothetical protein LCGC14_1605650, partial [marine sediment metagenome]
MINCTTEKEIITKHVPSQARVYEIVEEERKKDERNIIKGPTARSNTLELRDKIIHFIVWYDLEKIWKYVNGCFGSGKIDFSEIDKEFEMMKKMAHFRKSLY